MMETTTMGGVARSLWAKLPYRILKKKTKEEGENGVSTCLFLLHKLQLHIICWFKKNSLLFISSC